MKRQPNNIDTVAGIIAWENGDMDHEQEVAFFTHLRDTGLLFQLQGMYGRNAARLGLI